jgi:L,D-peptidoglycan transpeptidase YkuD (ErfK/YbiS/YcfS/YnhG family)
VTRWWRLVDAAMRIAGCVAVCMTVLVTGVVLVGERRAVAAPVGCAELAARVRVRHPSATSVVEVVPATGSATTATVQLATLVFGRWVCSAPMFARVGSAGVRPLAQRRSGDGTTPAGVFPLGRMTAWDGRVFRMFGNSADPGVAAGPFRKVVAGDCFGATPHTARYGHLVRRSAATCIGPDEYLPGVRGAYVYAALIGANMEPNVSGDAAGETPFAAAIFLHRHSYDGRGRTVATGGCVSLAHADLVWALRHFTVNTWFAIGTNAWLSGHM